MNGRTILVPTDFSDTSIRAVQYAAALALHFGAKIMLLHAVGIHASTTAQENSFIMAEEVARIEEDELSRLRLQYARKYPALEIEAASRLGFPVEVIAEYATSTHPDLIVMGTRGASGIKEMLIGSNTASLIRKTTYPIIAVPEDAEFRGISHIAFATNMHRDDVRHIKEIIALFGNDQPKITLLHTEGEHTRDAEAAFESWFHNEVLAKVDYTNLDTECLDEADLTRSLHQYIGINEVDLLVMATRKKNFIERIFDRSITEQMVFHSHTPIMVLHAGVSKGEMVF